MKLRLLLTAAGSAGLVAILFVTVLGGTAGAARRLGPPAPFNIASILPSAALVCGFGDCGQTQFLRRRGFSALTHPATGEYCLKPSAKGVDPQTRMLMTGIENDFGVVGFAAYRSLAPDCPAGWFQVETLDTSGAPSDIISFWVAVA
jgi:hypothetical protein